MYNLELNYAEFEYLRSILRSMINCDFVDFVDFVDDEYIYKAETIYNKLIQIND